MANPKNKNLPVHQWNGKNPGQQTVWIMKGSKVTDQESVDGTRERSKRPFTSDARDHLWTEKRMVNPTLPLYTTTCYVLCVWSSIPRWWRRLNKLEVIWRQRLIDTVCPPERTNKLIFQQLSPIQYTLWSQLLTNVTELEKVIMACCHVKKGISTLKYQYWLLGMFRMTNFPMD